MEVDLEVLAESIVEGDIEKCAELTKEALEQGTSPKQLLDEGLLPGLSEVGRRFQQGEYYFPELIVAGQAMKAALVYLKPALAASREGTVGRYLIGTVQGDIHDIGKDIVVMMLEGYGWDVTDLGIDVPAATFVKEVQNGDFSILGMSALLTTTVPRLAETIAALEAAGVRRKVKVMVGGVSVTQEYADSIGADAYGRDAFEAVTKAKVLADMITSKEWTK